MLYLQVTQLLWIILIDSLFTLSNKKLGILVFG